MERLPAKARFAGTCSDFLICLSSHIIQIRDFLSCLWSCNCKLKMIMGFDETLQMNIIT